MIYFQFILRLLSNIEKFDSFLESVFSLKKCLSFINIRLRLRVCKRLEGIEYI